MSVDQIDNTLLSTVRFMRFENDTARKENKPLTNYIDLNNLMSSTIYSTYVSNSYYSSITTL